MSTLSTWLISLLLIFGPVFDLGANGRSDIWVQRFQLCDPNADYDVKINGTLKTINNKHYLDGSLTLRSSLDNTVRSNASVEIFTGSNYQYAFSIYERKSCDAIQKYLDEFIYELERNAQIIPGICPIPEATYRVHNAHLNFEKIPVLGSVPVGNLRLTDLVYKRNQIYACLII